MTRPPFFRQNKYHNIRKEYRGVLFASTAEADYAEYLDELLRVERVFWWLGQPRVRLGSAVYVYQPDFLVFYTDGSHCFIDVKGMKTDAFKKHERMWKEHGPADLVLVKKASLGFNEWLRVEGAGKPQTGCGGEIIGWESSSQSSQLNLQSASS